MQRKKILLYISFSTFIVTLFSGCSGHILQDLIDGDAKKSKLTKASNESEKPATITPSKNSALNSISPSSTASHEHRYIQKSTHAWIKEEWVTLTDQNISDTDSNTSGSKEIVLNNNQTSENNESNISFSLQSYVDKTGVYLENKKKYDGIKTKKPSHTEKIDKMPVIGKHKGSR